MKQGRSSRTAEAAAALRANHFLHAEKPVFSDPYALEMAGQRWQKLLALPLFPQLLNSTLANRTFGLLTGQVVARSRFSEDLLAQAIINGTQQYVLVGAGLDSFTLRLAAQYPQLKIFEVDHPDTQQAKIAKLKTFGEIPHNVEFVAINFETEKLFDALNRSSYQTDQPAFFSWLGTTHYLTPEATLSTLENIAQNAAIKSEISLDYSVHYTQLAGIERFGTFAVGQFTKFLSEPLIGSFESNDLHEKLQGMNFDIIQDLSGHQITNRYFNNRPDHIKHTAATHLLHLKLK